MKCITCRMQWMHSVWSHLPASLHRHRCPCTSNARLLWVDARTSATVCMHANRTMAKWKLYQSIRPDTEVVGSRSRHKEQTIIFYHHRCDRYVRATSNKQSNVPNIAAEVCWGRWRMNASTHAHITTATHTHTSRRRICLKLLRKMVELLCNCMCSGGEQWNLIYDWKILWEQN